MELNKIYLNDCLEKLKELPENSVDSIVTDPPYGLGFMGKEWDIFDKKQFGQKGLEGKNDLKIKKNFNILPRYTSGIQLQEFTYKWATECLRVLKPGGHLLSFGGTRTYHRMACAIEDAGFEIRDMIEWVYGSGFPKSLNIGKVVNKFLKTGNASWNGTGDSSNGALGYSKLQYKQNYRPNDYSNRHQNKEGITEEMAKQWEGWGTALKPAHEPICMARKPIAEKTVAENVLKYGTGGINIDESRVKFKKGDEPSAGNRTATFGTQETVSGGDGSGGFESNNLGRFPANLIHDNSDEVKECFPEQKSGSYKGNGSKSGGIWSKSTGKPAGMEYGDSGNASRFFKSIIYVPKASRNERNMGLDNTAIVLIEWSIWNEKHTTQEVKKAELLVDMDILQPKDIEESGIQQTEDLEWNTLLFGKSLMAKYQKNIQSTILTGTNSTTTSQIFNWLVFLLTKEYIADVNLEKDNGGNLAVNADNSKVLTTTINEKMASRLGVKNVVLGTQLKISVKEGKSSHPTVKPIALMEYLIKMVTPKGGIVLDPFAGSGSTLIAAKQNGFKYIGIEKEAEYVKIAEARLKAVKDTLF